jgi:hypothetical protein
MIVIIYVIDKRVIAIIIIIIMEILYVKMGFQG